MPSSHRKKRSNLFDKSPKMLGELTLNDFANSPAPKGGRIKKAVTNDLMMAKIDDDSLPLDESEVKAERRRRRRKSSSSSSTSNSSKDNNIDNRPGKIYPIDLWFLLSEYIRPQDVLNFSLLCRGSYHVTNTCKFWINLHKRYCKAESVPKKFGRECLEKRHGLKPAVVKALFLACPSLNSDPTNHDPRELSGFLCILMWIERSGLNEDSVSLNTAKKWIYKFKLSKKPWTSNTRSQTNYCYKGQRTIKSESDINDNPDDGCKILTVPCKEYTAIPCVSGMRLSEVIYNQSKQLNLVFSSAPLNTSCSQMGNVSIRLHLSNGPTVFDWWHPSYHISSNV